MGTTGTAMLKHFLVFNPTFDKSEQTEHEKLLFHYPADVPQDTKMKTVGLSEALIKYTSTFSPIPCQVLRTQKARHAFYNPEPDFWLLMCVSLPFSQKTNKDGETVTEYHDEDVQDIVLEALLRQAYKMYKLFNGTMAHILEHGNREALIHKLDLFFPQYLEALPIHRADIVEEFDGIQFLPLDKNSYLRVQCFVNLAEATFPSIKYTVFLYNDHLVWSGLEQDDMRVLYKYLTSGMLDSAIPPEDPEATDSLADAISCLYVTGPESLTDPESPINTPRIYVTTVEESDELHLIILQTNGVKLCFLADGSAVVDLDFYQKLHKFVEPHAKYLDELIAEQLAKRASSVLEIQYKYLYFNHMNLAQKSSFITLPKKGNATSSLRLAPEYIRYLTDMHSDFSGSHEDSEILLKTRGDWWIVGRKSDQREFFVILNQKNANLIDINEEIRRLSATHFGNIFFID
eukprot:m.340234 g.340234  ORF g.340234 m.340234 type:complete len:460 (+) comp19187_c0_seq1:275-1654(+)